MRYGRLDRRVVIQRKTVTLSPAGAPVETWADIGARRWASVRPVDGAERFTDPQLAAKQQTEFEVRYSADVVSLTPLDRVVYPVPAEGDPVPVASIYDIVAVHEIGRREGLKIVTTRRSDG